MMPTFFRAVSLSIIGTSVLLTGCASGPDVFVNEDPTTDFGKYRTFGYQPDLDTDKAQYSSLTSQYLKATATRELEARGYKQSSNPDMIVNFHIQLEEKIRTTQTPTTGYGGGYYGYRGYNAWGGYGGYETRVTQYTEGTLNVDLVDAQRSQLIWEGVLIGKITKEVQENLESAVDQAVTEIFVQYPYIAGNSTQQPLQKK